MTELPGKVSCLDCGYIADSISNVVTDAKPQPGAITVCMRCGHIMAFGEGDTLRPLTDDEMIKIAGNPVLLEFQRLRAEAVKALKDRGISI